MTGGGDAAWEAVEALFHEALLKPAPHRTAFVEARAEAPEAVRAEVLELIAAHEAAEGRFDTPSPDDLERWAGTDGTQGDEAPLDLVGAALADCVLTRRIAGGGMGVVYEAVQTPPGRKVAVKLMRSAIVDRGLKARFEHEVRLLGGLQHPGICAIYGAGTHTLETGESLPFFVMEYLPEAVPLSTYVAKNERKIDLTLDKFMDVCDAVHHGHQRGVIHRDLKPDNVLVDVDGNPKVIDFGIARATDTGAEADTALTQTGQILGTLHYMSPEQLLGKEGDLDVRSDVYALGVMLYELLTGELPQAMRGEGLLEIARTIREVPPTPPSSIRAALAGDLQIILLKCLAKERSARYDSVENLRADLARFRAGEAILARPTTAIYRLRLFVRKNKALSTALAGIFVASLVGTVVSIAYARHARSEQRAAEVAREEATREAQRAKEARADAERETKRAREQRARADELLKVSAEFVPWATGTLDAELQGLRGSVEARRVLAEGVRSHVAKLELSDADSPVVRRVVGQALMGLARIEGGGAANLGKRDEALGHLREALGHYRSLQGSTQDDARLGAQLGSAHLQTALVHAAGGDTASARASLKDAEEVIRRYIGKHPGDDTLRAALADVVSARGDTFWLDDNFKEALAWYEKSVALCERLVTERLDIERRDVHRIVALVQGYRDMADAHEALGQTDAMVAVRAKADALLDTVPPGERSSSFFVMRWDTLRVAAERAFDAGTYEDALGYWRRAVDLSAAWVASDAANTRARTTATVAMGGVAITLYRLERFDEAATAFEEVGQRRSREMIADPTNRLLRHDAVVSRSQQAGLAAQMDQVDAGRKALTLAQRHLNWLLADHPDDPVYLRLGAALAMARGQVALAESRTAPPDSTLADFRAAYVRARDAFAEGQQILRDLHAREALPPQFHADIGRYGNLVRIVGEGLAKIEALIAEQEAADK